MILQRHVILMMLAMGLLILGAQDAGADPPGLLGHWKLSGDVNDDSHHRNHGNDRGVDLGAIGRDGRAGSAAGFDGRTSHVEIASNPSLQLGTSDFSIALWVDTARNWMTCSAISLASTTRSADVGSTSAFRTMLA